jgi:hypothetical protein
VSTLRPCLTASHPCVMAGLGPIGIRITPGRGK